MAKQEQDIEYNSLHWAFSEANTSIIKTTELQLSKHFAIALSPEWSSEQKQKKLRKSKSYSTI